jgi:RNA polymerase sigma-70 factor (ECF subfamily)
MELNEPEDFGAFYVRHAPLVRRVLVRRGVRSEDLDDVVQETFITVQRLLPDFEGRSTIETWLHAVAWRLAATYHRRSRRDAVSDLPETLAEPAAPFVSPGRVYASLARMQEQDRDSLLLHDIGGMSISAISDLTKAARVTVRQRVERGRAVLSRDMGGQRKTTQLSQWLEVDAFRPEATQATEAAPVLERVDEDTCLSTLEDVVLVVWRGPVRDDALRKVIRATTRHADAMPDGFRYLAIVEATSSAPTRQGRQMISHMVRALGSRFKAAASAVHGSALMSLVSSILNSYFFLASAPVNKRFFGDVTSAATWLAQYGSVEPERLIEHVQAMRACLDSER